MPTAIRFANGLAARPGRITSKMDAIFSTWQFLPRRTEATNTMLSATQSHA